MAGPRGLLPSLLPMPVGSGGMAGGGGSPNLRDLGGDVLELLVGRLFQTGGRLEADLRDPVGDLDSQERGHFHLSSGPDSGQGSFSASGLKTGLDRGLCG